MSAPAQAHDYATDGLDPARLSADRRENFHLRLDRYWSDLSDAIGALYADAEVAERLTESLLERAASAYADRADDLHRLDQERLLQPDWLQQPRMFGYACYTERFGGSLPGVKEHLDYLEDLGVTYLHLMPLLQPREGDNDGGYAVQDYRAVRPDLGTVDDLRDLATTLRSRGISLVVDLVLNHNVTGGSRPCPLGLIQALGLISPYEALSGYDLQVGADGILWLPPYGAWWLVDRPDIKFPAP